MNALTILLIGLCVYALAYRFYATFIISKVLAFIISAVSIKIWWKIIGANVSGGCKL
ncbi:MAG: hypothetical protein KA059_06695 [Elusimicrobiales bacterium]|nr:hypothetical protein [Elusimicrobiales bacterium]